MGSYNKRISDQSKIKFDPINRELIDSENSELDSRVESLEENITGSKTATGNPLTVTDAAPVNAVNLSMDLEPIQAGSGTPSPDNIRPISGRTEVVITQKDNLTNPTVTKTYTIQLGDTIYGGELDVVTGELTVTYGEVDLGDLSYNYVPNWNGAGVFESTSLPNYKKVNDSTKANVISENYETVSRNTLYNNPTSFGVTTSGTGDSKLYIRDSRYTSASDFKTAVTGQQLVYELATPYSIDLTPQQIKLLENTNTITTDYDGDVLSLEYQPNNAFGELLGEVNNIYDSIIENIYDKIDSLDTRVTALEE